MLKIRSEQIDALERAARADFVKRLATDLRAWFPEHHADLSEATTRDRVERLLDRAATYGFESERHVAQFACLSVVLGPDFDEAPDVRPLLADRGQAASDRLAEVYRRAIAAAPEA